MSDPSVGGWLRSVTPGTSERFRHYLEKFCDFSRLSPSELLTLAQSDKVKTKEKLVEFYGDYVQKGYALNTSRNAIATISSFLSYNEITFGRFLLIRHGAAQYESRRIFTYSEVFRMLVGARTPRNRAIISFVLQSGQRVGVITKIRYGDVRKQIENSISPVVIDVDPNISKNRVRHSFAIGRECVDFIKSMMKDRERWGEPIDDESILFRSLGVGKRWIEGQLLPGGSIDRSERGWAFRTGQIGWIMRKAATDAGVTLNKMTHTSFPRWSHFELHPHAFRRWWKSMMRRGGVKDPVFLDFMLGHYEPYDGAYDAFDHDYIRQEYAKAEPQLTFLRDRSELAHSQQENNSQRIVDEHEASALLSEGWRFVTTLPSGRLVVQKDPSPRAMGA